MARHGRSAVLRNPSDGRGQVSTRVFHETFEGSGYAETWSAGETVGGSSTLDEDTAVSATGTPPSWGAQCLEATVVNPDTQAFVQHNFGVERPATWTRIEFIVGAEGLADNDAFGIAVALNASGTQTIWQLLLQQIAGDVRIIAQVYHDGAANNLIYAGIEVDKRYRVEIKWDSTNDLWEWRVDGATLGSGALTGSAAGWGFQHFKLGMDSSVAQGTTIYYDNVTVDVNDWVGPGPIDMSTTSILVFKEHFELVGTDETWSDGQIISAGNTADADQATSGITGAPGDWDLSALKIAIGAAPATGAALYRHLYSTKKDVVYLSVDLIWEVNGLTNGQLISFAVLKESHAGGVNVLQAYLRQNSSGNREIQCTVGDNLDFNFAENVSLDTRHTLQYLYDGSNSYWAIVWDGALIATGHIRSTWGQQVEALVAGSSASSTGRSSTYYVDNFIVAATGWPSLTGQKSPSLGFHQVKSPPLADFVL